MPTRPPFRQTHRPNKARMARTLDALALAKDARESGAEPDATSDLPKEGDPNATVEAIFFGPSRMPRAQDT